MTEEQKKECVPICKENLVQIESGRWRKHDVVTGDETWIYLKDRKWRNLGTRRYGSPSTAVCHFQFKLKSFFCIFFMTNGPLSIRQVPRRQPIIDTYYQKNYWEALAEWIKAKRAAKEMLGIKLHFNNALPHKTSIVNAYLTKYSIAVKSHPHPGPCSLRFLFFTYIKPQLKTYSNEETLKWGVTDWIERTKLCIHHGGDYFEHLK